MTVDVVLLFRGCFRGTTIPLALAVGEDVGAEVYGFVDRLKRLVGKEMLERLDKVFEEALRDEIRVALNTDNLERGFPALVERFWLRIAFSLVDLSNSIHTSLASGALTLAEFRGVVEELAKSLAKRLKSSGYKYADDLVYAMSILVERDLWIADRVARLGLEEFANRLTSRAPDAVLQFAAYSMYLAFAWTSATVAVLNIVREYSESNIDALARWSHEYAKEVEGYIDTLDLLLDDEVYSNLLELGIIKRGNIKR
ncbi:MAG: hypothetical protein QW348_06885 [Ignisphaera sp.]